MIDRLYGLRHDSVVGRYYKDRNICSLCASHTHGGKGFMAGSIKEGYGSSVYLYGISADRLRDAAGFF